MTKDLMFESWTPSQVKTFFFSSTITKSLVCLDLHPRHKNTFDFLKNAVTWSITTHLNPLTQNWQFIRISDGRITCTSEGSPQRAPKKLDNSEQWLWRFMLAICQYEKYSTKLCMFAKSEIKPFILFHCTAVFEVLKCVWGFWVTESPWSEAFLGYRQWGITFPWCQDVKILVIINKLPRPMGYLQPPHLPVLL